MRRTRALAVTAAATLLLTACTASDTPTPDATGTTAPGATPAAPDAPPPGPLPTAAATDDCVVGTWRLDLAAMQGELRDLVAGSGDGEVEVTLDGTTTYEFEVDGRFTAAVDSSSSVAMSAGGDELRSTSASAGDLEGTWVLADGVLTIADVDPQDLDVTTTATLGGDPLDVPAGSAEDAIEALPPTSSTATCSPDALALTASPPADAGGDAVGITYVLRR
ncbi:hypothetical protein [Cellulomonas phragmiteti]|uniref:hypothetical protein n=1 Tax=Cellulomonas phragmiteti TaxID=478780 RepID=UPI001942C73E|nr:hypothetical protein [Cellulomonas phragmiteti]